MFLSLLRRVLRFLGVDRAIGYTLVGQVWGVLAGPVSVLFLARFLSPVEQGFYYTFNGVLAMGIFLELGLGFVLLQFASHEKADLEWTPGGTLEGSDYAKARLSSLLRRVLFWYGVMAVLLVVLMVPGGLWFFNRQPSSATVVWQGPWVWVTIFSSANLLLTPLFSVLEGCGLVAQIAAQRTVQRISFNLATWLCLFLGFGLYAVVAFNATMFLVSCIWLWSSQRVAVADLLARSPHPAHVDWWREVWPLQWRVALSGISSYFIFAFFNPVLFNYHGPVVAGRMGMSLTMVGAIAAVPMVWVATKLAPFGTLIAKGQWRELDRLFFPAMWRSLALMAGSELLLWLVVCYLSATGHRWSERLLDPLSLGFLILATLSSSAVGCLALYLRAHKQEPYVWLSVVSAAFIALSTYALGRPYAALGMAVGYLVVSIATLIGGIWIFLQKRRQWHQDEAPANATGSDASLPDVAPTDAALPDAALPIEKG